MRVAGALGRGVPPSPLEAVSKMHRTTIQTTGTARTVLIDASSISASLPYAWGATFLSQRSRHWIVTVLLQLYGAAPWEVKKEVTEAPACRGTRDIENGAAPTLCAVPPARRATPAQGWE